MTKTLKKKLRRRNFKRKSKSYKKKVGGDDASINDEMFREILNEYKNKVQQLENKIRKLNKEKLELWRENIQLRGRLSPSLPPPINVDSEEIAERREAAQRGPYTSVPYTNRWEEEVVGFN